MPENQHIIDPDDMEPNGFWAKILKAEFSKRTYGDACEEREVLVIVTTPPPGARDETWENYYNYVPKGNSFYAQCMKKFKELNNNQRIVDVASLVGGVYFFGEVTMKMGGGKEYTKRLPLKKGTEANLKAQQPGVSSVADAMTPPTQASLEKFTTAEAAVADILKHLELGDEVIHNMENVFSIYENPKITRGMLLAAIKGCAKIAYDPKTGAIKLK